MPFNGWDTLQDSDALFISDIQGHTPFYRFKVNNNCIGVIFSEPADCAVPALATFDTNGNKIDQKDILVGRCGGMPEPGFIGDEFMIIRKDYSIYTSDTITESKVDKDYNNIPHTAHSFVIYRKGKLLSSGKIELSDTLRENLKKIVTKFSLPPGWIGTQGLQFR